MVEGSDETIAAALARAPLPPPAARQRLAAALGPFAIVDLETTGLDASRAAVIEVGAVLVQPGGDAVLFHRLVDPGKPLPPVTRRLTGLSDAELRGAPLWQDAGRDLAALLAGATIVAHNAAFERAFLGDAIAGGTPFLDTLELACVLRPELPAHNLEQLALSLLGRPARHRALDDALDTLALLSLLEMEIRAGEHDELRALLAEVEHLWPWAVLFRGGGPAGLGALGLAAARRDTASPPGEDAAVRPGDGARPPPATARTADWRRQIPETWYEPAFLQALLADEARWRRVLPGYRARDGQIELACAILEAFRTQRAVAAEAGTGIGKTLAYCLVALLHARRTGERVIVSSANRTLQERVVSEELPRIAAVLGVPAPPAIVLKGRANYPSRLRARAIALEPSRFGFPSLSAAARLYLTNGLRRAPSRDLQGFGGWLASQEAALRAVRERIACSSDCDERRCRAEAEGPCAYLRRVDGLEDAALVSINHALLLNWPARYGRIERLIVDEAHELAAEGDRAFAEEVRSRDLRAWLGQLGASGRAGLVVALADAAGDGPAAGRVAELVRQAGQGIEASGRALLDAGGQQEALVPAADAREPGSPWPAAEEAVGHLAQELVRLGGELEGLAEGCRGPGGPAGRGATEALAVEAASLGAALGGAGRGLLGDLFLQSRPATVYAARSFRRAQEHDWWVRATPLEIAPLIYDRLLEPAKTVVAVSATLGVRGDPAASLERIGWSELEPERRLPALAVPTPFDFRRQAVLALARGDSWRRAGFAGRCATAIAEIARLLGGRTLGLFTNRQRLSEVAARLAPGLAEDGIAVLAHERTGGAARLVEQFAADPRAVLLGTRSLWQGIDVPGDALSCVVIDKLPFPPPNDPLVRGRAERLRAAGGDPFRSLMLEPAVVGFKQMFGRLIRSETDRGFVVVLGADPEKGYVEEFVASLPGPPRLLVDEVGGIVEAMRRFFAVPA